MSKQLQKFLLITFTAILLMMQFREARASHAMGADLTYECLGGNTYRIRVSFYRDCIGIPAPNNVFVNIRSVTCGQNLGITCDPIPGTGQEVTPLCPSAISSCNGGIFTGIQEWVYEGVVTLPMQCTDWVFSYNLCCRNAAITTITNPGTSTFYIYASLNNTISPCNTSPTFSNKPVPFACVGQQYCFNHGAFDADGDSLVYSLITPYQNATTTVDYIPPFNATDPLTSAPAVTFNPATGDICMTPQNLEVTVMAVLVSEYRNGVLIGTVERDIQITVLSCNNTLPTLSGINGTNNFDITVCAGEQLCFDILSTDPDPGQNVFINWDGSIPAGTFTSNGATRPTGTFCWTPTQADISSNPYCFTVRVNDDACPMIGAQIYSYCINVIGINVNAGPDQFIACNDLATVNVTASGGTGNYTYLWSNGITLPIQTVGVGTYIVTVNDGVCSNQDTVVVANAFEPTAAFTAVGTCPNTPVQFTDQSTLPGGTIISWNWNFDDGGTSTIQNPIHQFPGPGTYNVSLIIETSFGCIDTVVVPVTIAPPPVAAFNVGQGCAGTSLTFNNTTTPPGNYNWLWNFGNGTGSTLQNPGVVYANPGTYTVTLVAGDTTGCADSTVQQVVINPLPIPAFTYSAIACQGGNITFVDSSNGNGGTITGWNWTFGNGQTSNGSNPVINYPNPGNYDVTLVVTNSFGCTASILQTIAINPPPVANAGANQIICLGGTATLVASGGVSYSWSPGGYTTDVINVSPSSNTTYTVTVTDANGCTATATVNVNVNPLPVINVSPSQSTCLGQSVTLTATGGVSYNWSPSGNTTGTITVSPGSSTTYAVTGTNANGCSATNFVSVTVNPLPNVNLSNLFICAGISSSLNAGNPGSTYLWSNGQTTQSIPVSSPGVYSVTVTNQYGCTGGDSSVVSQGGTIVNNLTNVAFCAGGSAVLDAGNPGNSFLWSNGSTSQTITVSAAGAYSVTITDANGCSGTLSTTVNVNPLPDAQFTPNDVCINEPMQFMDVSTIGSGSITGWSWSFGDGNVSQQQNPSHFYPSSGAFAVTLVVTSNMGCVDSLIKTFNVFPLPAANFTFLNSCEGSAVNFTNTSTTSVGNITGWQWSFGDGTTASQQHPSHVFGTPGIYPVDLLITTAGGCVDSIQKQITISPLPVASFTAGQSCKGSPVAFNSTSGVPGGVLSSWFWDFGNGTTSTLQNPSAVYNNSGTYNVSLIVTSSNGCNDTISQPVLINPLPVADAGSPQILCRGTSATLNATGGVSYLWSNGSATQSTSVTPVVNSTYQVTVTDVNGCTSTDSVRVYINNLPNVFAGPDKTICAGTPVTLNVTGALINVWMPGNITGNSVSVSPLQTTTYIVTGTSSNGCINTDTVTVNVNPLPLANAGPDQMICEGTTATITATGGVSYQWTPTGASTASIYVNPLMPTVYAVQVTDANGCKAWDSVSVGINPTPIADLSPAFICIGTTTILDAENPGSSYLWSPNGETTQTILVSDSGYYDVIIISPNGCIGYAGTTVTVGGNGLSANPTNVQICDGETTVLSAGNPTATYLWSNGATTQTINVSTAGSYTVTITDVYGCSASFASNVVTNPVPALAFVSSPTCESNITLFTNTTTLASGNITGWLWDFGDGNSSNAQAPSNLYATPGTYNVTLSATTGMGCTSQLSLPVTVEPMPVAAFGNTVACLGSGTIFTDSSQISSGAIANWNWNFGDGTVSTDQNPVHTYNAPGVYTASLLVASTNGCSDSITAQVQVYDTPLPQFSLSNVCDGTAVNFTNSSVISDGVISGYNWDFGDGSTDTSANPTYQYSNAGTFNVTLTAVSDLGCSASLSQPVTIYSNPQTSITATPVCEGIATSFTGNTTVTNANISNVYWSFGDGGSSNLQNPTHLFAGNGTYQVLLTATSDQGCVDSAMATVTVYPVPAAAFNGSDACLYSSVNLSDLSTIASGSIVNWNWNLGDGNSSSVQNPVHSFATPGSYQISLLVTTDQGCTDSIQAQINVYPVPTANFTRADVCQGTVSEFFNQSQVAGGGIVNCSWDFGDGNTSTDQNPQHVFATSGNYNVTLIATTQNGCSDTITQQVTIYATPIAAFGFVNACDESPVSFTDLSTSIDGSISSWNWNFGDGTTTAAADPYHTFSGPGNYAVTLTVTSLHGCSGSITDSVSVFELPVPVISVSNNCVGDPTSFSGITAIGDTAVYDYQWTFGDGNTSAIQNPMHQYTAAGTYAVSLTMTNANGCVANATSSVTLYPVPEPGFDFADACAESSVQFNNTSTISSGSITQYIWNFGDGSSGSGLVNPVHTFDSAGVYNITLIAVSDNGCIDSTTQQITVFPLPVSNFSYSQAAGCGPLTIYFTDSSFVTSGTIVAWAWNFGNGETSNLQNPSTVYSSSGTYGVSLTVTTDMGCTQTFTQPNAITIYPGPEAAFTPNPYEASILHPIIDFENTSSGATLYNWTFGDGLSSTLFEPVHTYPDTGWYEVVLHVQNSYGCFDTVSHWVYIIPEFTLYVPNAFTPNQDGINDAFSIAGIGIVSMNLEIFNRWGENIYTTSSRDAGWDGSVQKDNGLAQQDVYVYQVTVKDVFGKTHQRVGTVTLVR
ncbi:MAG: PKD domain-containing protein [Bacteroidetes bacterium]|nr:PKD domain-containing protein [Bacteroidota bacterium]